MSQNRRNRRKQKINADKKAYKTVINIGSNYRIEELKTNKDGTKTMSLEISDSTLTHGHTTETGKFKPALIAPSGEYDIVNIFNDDGYFCFVDTNKLKNSIPENPQATHLAGFYIFRVKKLTRHNSGASVETDFKNSIIRCVPIISQDDINPELMGWDEAVKELKRIGATKAKIFVDSEQGKLKEHNTKLPKGYNLFYTSADRKPTIFNTIFSRLDKLINHTAANLGPLTNLYRGIDYLWGNIDHLPKE